MPRHLLPLSLNMRNEFRIVSSLKAAVGCWAMPNCFREKILFTFPGAPFISVNLKMSARTETTKKSAVQTHCPYHGKYLHGTGTVGGSTAMTGFCRFCQKFVFLQLLPFLLFISFSLLSSLLPFFLPHWHFLPRLTLTPHAVFCTRGCNVWTDGKWIMDPIWKQVLVWKPVRNTGWFVRAD